MGKESKSIHTASCFLKKERVRPDISKEELEIAYRGKIGKWHTGFPFAIAPRNIRINCVQELRNAPKAHITDPDSKA